MQSDVVAGWTDTAVRKLKQCITRMMFEAGLLESSAQAKDYQTHPYRLSHRRITGCKWTGRIPEGSEGSLRDGKIKFGGKTQPD